MHARRCGRDRLDVVDALGGFNESMDQDRLSDAVFGFELGEKLIEVMNVPWSFDLRQHDDVELGSNRGDDLGHIVERPRRVECVDPRPQPGGAEVAGARHGDKAGARHLLGVDGNGVFEVAEDDVDLRNEVRHFGADLLHVRRNEMDHPLQPQRQFTQRRRRTNRKWLEKIARQFHRQIRLGAVMSLRCKTYTISPRISFGCDATGVMPSRIMARRKGPMRSTR